MRGGSVKYHAPACNGVRRNRPRNTERGASLPPAIGANWPPIRHFTPVGRARASVYPLLAAAIARGHDPVRDFDEKAA